MRHVFFGGNREREVLLSSRRNYDTMRDDVPYTLSKRRTEFIWPQWNERHLNIQCARIRLLVHVSLQLLQHLVVHAFRLAVGIEEPHRVDDHERPDSALLEHLSQVSSSPSEARRKHQGTRFRIPHGFA